MSDLQKTLDEAMQEARKEPGGLEEFLRDLRLAILDADEPGLAKLLRDEKGEA